MAGLEDRETGSLHTLQILKVFFFSFGGCFDFVWLWQAGSGPKDRMAGSGPKDRMAGSGPKDRMAMAANY